jgi:hypothetical protein
LETKAEYLIFESKKIDEMAALVFIPNDWVTGTKSLLQNGLRTVRAFPNNF